MRITQISEGNRTNLVDIYVGTKIVTKTVHRPRGSAPNNEL